MLYLSSIDDVIEDVGTAPATTGDLPNEILRRILTYSTELEDRMSFRSVSRLWYNICGGTLIQYDKSSILINETEFGPAYFMESFDLLTAQNLQFGLDYLLHTNANTTVVLYYTNAHFVDRVTAILATVAPDMTSLNLSIQFATEDCDSDDESVDIEKSENFSLARTVSKLPKLTQLKIRASTFHNSVHLSEIDMQALSEMKLTRLTVQDFMLPTVGVLPLTLKELKFNCSVKEHENEQCLDVFLDKLPPLNNLTSLVIHDAEFDTQMFDKFCSILGGLKQLERVTLKACNLVNVSELTRLPDSTAPIAFIEIDYECEHTENLGELVNMLLLVSSVPQVELKIGVYLVDAQLDKLFKIIQTDRFGLLLLTLLPYLDTLSLQDVAILKAAPPKLCTVLKEIHLSNVKDPHVLSVFLQCGVNGKKMENLTKCYLTACPLVTDDTMKNLSEYAPMLTYLNVCKCKKVTGVDFVSALKRRQSDRLTIVWQKSSTYLPDWYSGVINRNICNSDRLLHGIDEKDTSMFPTLRGTYYRCTFELLPKTSNDRHVLYVQNYGKTDFNIDYKRRFDYYAGEPSSDSEKNKNLEKTENSEKSENPEMTEISDNHEKSEKPKSSENTKNPENDED